MSGSPNGSRWKQNAHCANPGGHSTPVDALRSHGLTPYYKSSSLDPATKPGWSFDAVKFVKSSLLGLFRTFFGCRLCDAMRDRCFAFFAKADINQITLFQVR
jgi:hypothetical protein